LNLPAGTEPLRISAGYRAVSGTEGQQLMLCASIWDPCLGVEVAPEGLAAKHAMHPRELVGERTGVALHR